MDARARSGRRPSAVLGFMKAFGMLFAMLFALPVWVVRGIVARARFRSELRAAGIPQRTAKKLSDRYKIRLRDFKRFRPAIN
jgi:hypothetical protein